MATFNWNCDSANCVAPTICKKFNMIQIEQNAWTQNSNRMIQEKEQDDGNIQLELRFS